MHGIATLQSTILLTNTRDLRNRRSQTGFFQAQPVCVATGKRIKSIAEIRFLGEKLQVATVSHRCGHREETLLATRHQSHIKLGIWLPPPSSLVHGNGCYQTETIMQSRGEDAADAAVVVVRPSRVSS